MQLPMPDFGTRSMKYLPTFRTLTVSALSEVMHWSTTDLAWYMVWPGGHDMVCGMVCRAWHGIWYGLEGRAGHMVWPGEHGLVYGIASRGMGWYMVWPGGLTCIWYCQAGMAWYMVWSSRHCIVYGVVWRAWHGIWYGLVRHRIVYVLAWRGVVWYM